LGSYDPIGSQAFWPLLNPIEPFQEKNMSVNFGSKRIVVGAHYGLRDWLAQRVTALLMALFTVLVILQVVLTKGSIGYDTWSGIFSTQWMKSLTFAVIISLAYHAWVGMRDIWMDYVQAVAFRLLLQVFTLVWLVSCSGWAIQVIWRL
jgi:succinate dehydrogenase / fumarate reductase membrane anchor subunit